MKRRSRNIRTHHNWNKIVRLRGDVFWAMVVIVANRANITYQLAFEICVEKLEQETRFSPEWAQSAIEKFQSKF